MADEEVEAAAGVGEEQQDVLQTKHDDESPSNTGDVCVDAANDDTPTKPIGNRTASVSSIIIVPEVGAAAAARAAAVANLQSRSSSQSAQRENPFEREESSPPIPVLHVAAATSHCVGCNAVLMTQAEFCSACGQKQPGKGNTDPTGLAIPDSTNMNEPVVEDNAPVVEPVRRSSAKESEGFFSKYKRKLTRPDAKEEEELQQQALVSALQLARTTQRSNLLNMTKIAIKTLIESSVGYAQGLTEEHTPLRQLLLVLEKIFQHGIKTKKLASFGQKKYFFPLFESLERTMPEIEGIMQEVRNIPSIRSPIGKARACIRLAIQKKAIADVMRAVADAEATIEMYDDWAMLRADEAHVISGLVMSIIGLEFDFDLRGEQLDTDQAVVDYSIYLKDGNYLKPAVDNDDSAIDDRFSEANFSALSDQKALLEENCRTLKQQVENTTRDHNELQEKYSELEVHMGKLETQFIEEKLKAEEARAEARDVKSECLRKMKALEADVATERETYSQSRTGLDEMYGQLQKKLDQQKGIQKGLEDAAKEQQEKKDQLEETIESLEKDLLDREESINALRKQLKDVKALNIVMLSNVQDLEAKLKTGEGEAAKGKRNEANLAAEINTLKGQIRDLQSNKKRMEGTLLEITDRLKDVDAKRVTLETNIMIEKQWRESLQIELAEEREKLMEIPGLKSELETLRDKQSQLEARCAIQQKTIKEQEQALVDMGESMAHQAMKAHDLEQKKKSEGEKTWQDDKEVVNCATCTKSFGVKRRKHHCRKCGGVFCNECSDNKMPLPAFAKPVRVCDKCAHDILQNMNTA